MRLTECLGGAHDDAWHVAGNERCDVKVIMQVAIMVAMVMVMKMKMTMVVMIS